MNAAPFPQGALSPMLQRGANGETRFCESLVDQHAFTMSEARTILATLLKLKLAKVDYGVGAVNVRHGGLLDVEPLRRILADGKARGL